MHNRRSRQFLHDRCPQRSHSHRSGLREYSALVALPGAKGRPSGDDGDSGPRPLSGRPEAIAAELRDYAAAGIGHVQLVLDPITAASVGALAPVLEALDAT